jgi:hypothetical protein
MFRLAFLFVSVTGFISLRHNRNLCAFCNWARQWLLACRGHPAEVREFWDCTFRTEFPPPNGLGGFGFGMPVVGGARDANHNGRRMSKLKANGHKLRLRVSAILVTATVIMILAVFHNDNLD